MLMLLVGLSGSLAILAYLSSLNVWFLVDVVTDGFSAFDKIHRSMDLLIAGFKLGFSFSCDGQSSSTVGLLLLVGVTLCLPHRPGTTRVTLLPSSANCHQLYSWNRRGCPGMEVRLTRPGELIYVELHLECWVFLAYIKIQCVYLL